MSVRMAQVNVSVIQTLFSIVGYFNDSFQKMNNTEWQEFGRKLRTRES